MKNNGPYNFLGGLMGLVENLDNRISKGSNGQSKGDIDMAKRLKDKVIVNGKTFWIDGYSNQDLYEHYVSLLEREGLVKRIGSEELGPFLADYAKIFFETYKTKQQKNTIVNRERILRNHILPKLGDIRVTAITTIMIQKWFNEMADEYSRETILKIKNTLSPVMDSAVEDGIIEKNPLKSKRLEIHGKDIVHHKAIPKAKMDEIRSVLPELEPKLRHMGGLLCYTGMRFEEILGLRGEDISGGWITICRAVVHPDRNQPVLKSTKTVSSDRLIPCPDKLSELLQDARKIGFILSSDKDQEGETPMSYSEARRVYKKLQKRFDIREYTPHDFRDTCATEWRENGVSLDVIARLLGHAKTETTERRYVKYRTDIFNETRKLMERSAV